MACLGKPRAPLPVCAGHALAMRKWAVALVAVVVVLVGLVVFQLVRQPPPVRVETYVAQTFLPGRQPTLAWPSQGEAAIGVEGVGIVGAHGYEQPTPIASVAKIMTAYLILKDHPLAIGASGPLIRITPADVATYRYDRSTGQSVVAVRAGEKLSELEALEALLIPSGNNIATLLAEWDAGSLSAFVAKMNATAKSLGLTATHYADASGLSPATVSDAIDQTRLAMIAMQNPVFASIVAMPQVVLPVAGLQYNVDGLLGRDGIIGVKTGSTNQAGGCFVFAVRRTVAGRPVTVVGAVLAQMATRAQPSIIEAAFQATTQLVNSFTPYLTQAAVPLSGEIRIGSLMAPWASAVPLEIRGAASFLGWSGMHVSVSLTAFGSIRLPVAAGERVGWAVLRAGSEAARLPVVATRGLSSPSLLWRLRRI